MTTAVKIIEDSSFRGTRLTTIEVEVPYIIWPQVLTHRDFSRNAQSNRALPTKKLIEKVLSNPYNPVFRANKPGMVAGEKISQFWPKVTWSLARRFAIMSAKTMNFLGVHKETTNRLLLPFMHITALITATEWDNFFALRIEDNAQPEIQELARAIRYAMDSSTPRILEPGDWHLPYVSEKERSCKWAKKLSVARCARVSYLNHDRTQPDMIRDIDLYEDLITSKPVHGSPAEHQGTPIIDNIGATHWLKDGTPKSNNFTRFAQYRALL
jgi:thymidylate synthase ThyX